MKFRALVFVAGLLLAAGANAASVATVNPAQLQIPATGVDFNNLIQAINAILTPLIPNVASPVNSISLTAGATGSQAMIGLQTGADTNAGIMINPNGSGNITLFSQLDTGVLQFGNQSSFVKAAGLVACPAAVKNNPFGVAPVVTGYFLAADWLGVQHAIPGC